MYEGTQGSKNVRLWYWEETLSGTPGEHTKSSAKRARNSQGNECKYNAREFQKEMCEEVHEGTLKSCGIMSEKTPLKNPQSMHSPLKKRERNGPSLVLQWIVGLHCCSHSHLFLSRRVLVMIAIKDS